MKAMWTWVFMCVCVVQRLHGRVLRSTDLDPDVYLERFGYLVKAPDDVQHSPEAREEAIRNFQRMMGLEVTGAMDEATITKMEQPRCGLPDVVPAGDIPEGAQGDRARPENYYVPGYKWTKDRLTWRTENYSPDMSQSSQRRAFYQAFDYWQNEVPMEFVEIGDGEADIRIKFAYGEHGDGPGNAFDGSNGILAHAYYPEDGDTHFDEAEDWTEYTYDGYNLAIVAAHEFGHALGLGHSNVPAALMAPTYQGYVPDFKLHDDDIQAIQSLYGVRLAPTTTTHAPTQRPPSTPDPNEPVDPNRKPDTCSSKFDAILQAHDANVYIFKGKWIWRVDDYYGVMEGFPKLIRKVYDRPPQNIGGAVYSWRTRYTYFFKGNKIWKYYGFDRLERRQISTRGYPTKIDAAFIGQDGVIYLLSGSNYYIFDEYHMELQSTSAQSIASKWPGVPTNIEAALRLRDGFIYFFKGLKYRKYDEYYSSVMPGYPTWSHPAWMGPDCGGNFDPK